MDRTMPMSDIERLPYVTGLPRDGRVVPIGVFYHEPGSEPWHLYLPHDDKNIVRAYAEPIESSYLAALPENRDTDWNSPLGSLVMRHLSYKDTWNRWGYYSGCVYRFSQVMAKYVLLSGRTSRDENVGLLVESELEYLAFLVRSYFDLLHQVGGTVLEKCIEPTTGHKVMKNFPESCSKMTRCADLEGKLEDKYGVPRVVAEWYGSLGPFFQSMRDFRDSIAHHGQRVSAFCRDERGLCISENSRLWGSLEVLADGAQNRKLLPVREVFARIIHQSLGASASLANVLRELLGENLPHSICGELSLYYRGPYTEHLVRIPEYLECAD